MPANNALKARHRHFEMRLWSTDLGPLPEFRNIVLTCDSARMDASNSLGLDLGDAVLIRNNGGRIRDYGKREIATLVFVVASMDRATGDAIALVIVQRTQCGTEHFANLEFRNAIRPALDIDLSGSASTDHDKSLRDDMER